MRLFTAITLPPNVKKKLLATSFQIKNLSIKGNFSSFENYHITLVFLGQVKRNDISFIKKSMDKAAAIYPPMFLNCSDVEYFKKGNSKILYYNVGGNTDILSELQNFLYQRFFMQSLCREQKEYTPHITFARQTKIDEIPPINQKIQIPAGEITLMHSTRIDGKLTYLPIYSSPFTGTITIDRIEDKIAVCESISGSMFNVRKSLLPKGISSGSKISYNGLNFSLDKKETQKSSDKIKTKFDKEIRKH